QLTSSDDAGWWEGTTDGDIVSQAEALKSALPFSIEKPEQTIFTVENTMRRRATIVWSENQWWIGPTGLVMGLIGLLPLFF
ncbi:MAG: hypothetical protein JHD10_09650, partial [Sphingomonadaceae bacterium]|nr:hypothetical protein [Sphingomonadaceae bacterium]